LKYIVIEFNKNVPVFKSNPAYAWEK